MDRTIYFNGLIKFLDGVKRGRIVVDQRSGLILDVQVGGAFAGQASTSEESQQSFDDNCLIVPGDFNAHSHPEQSLYTDIVDKSWDLPTWCRNTIYKFSPLLQPEHIYLACARAFSRMLLLGVTSVVVSFYCHNRQGNVYDAEVLRAARDTGIRLYFGRMNYDIINEDAYEAKRNSQRGYFETREDAEENFLQLLKEVEASANTQLYGSPKVVVAPSVHSIHASTREAIVRAINLANKYKRYVQLHLSEDKGDVNLALEWYKCRPIEFLVQLLERGEVESLENLLLSDCVWLDEREMDLIQEYDMQVVLNPRMNARIKTGEADFPALLRRGIKLYLGTDGEASNDDLSITGEREFLRQRFPEVRTEEIAKLGMAPFKFKDGYIGSIAQGNYADLCVLRGSKVQEVFVGGQKVVADGALTTLNVDQDVEKPLRKLMEKTIAAK